MPLKCFSPDGPVYAFDLDREGFERLRAEHRENQHLKLPCCDAALGLRVSPLGTQHFYHLARGGCTSEPETKEHLLTAVQIRE